MYDEILTLPESIVASVFVMIIILLTLYIMTLVLECVAKVINRKDARCIAAQQPEEQRSADDSADELEVVIMAAAIAMMDGNNSIEFIRFKEIDN